MAEDRSSNPPTRVLHGLASVGGRAAARTLRPLGGAVGAATEAGIGLERRALDRVLSSDELERVLMTVLESPHLQASLRRALGSDGMRQLVDSFFDTGLFDHFIDRLLESDALWRLVDLIAQSPAVTAAVSQQGLGFADQVGGAVRSRSRRADDRLERTARRLFHRQAQGAPEPEANGQVEVPGPGAPGQDEVLGAEAAGQDRSS